MRLSVPYYSQHRDVADPEWQTKACGIACLKMLLEARGIGAPPLDAMIQVGVSHGAYSSNGWIHDGLIKLATFYGGEFYRKEFRKKDANAKTLRDLGREGISLILAEINAGRPVMVSAIKDFSIRDKFHLVLVVGAKITSGVLEGFYYHDPDSLGETEGAYRFVHLDIFENNWRQMAIFSKK